MAEKRHVTAEHYAPDIEDFTKDDSSLLGQLRVEIVDNIQKYVNDLYSKQVPVTTLQAEEQGILQHVSRTNPDLEGRVKDLMGTIKRSKFPEPTM